MQSQLEWGWEEIYKVWKEKEREQRAKKALFSK